MQVAFQEGAETKGGTEVSHELIKTKMQYPQLRRGARQEFGELSVQYKQSGTRYKTLQIWLSQNSGLKHICHLQNNCPKKFAKFQRYFPSSKDFTSLIKNEEWLSQQRTRRVTRRLITVYFLFPFLLLFRFLSFQYQNRICAY